MSEVPVPQQPVTDDHSERVHPGTHPTFGRSMLHAIHGVRHVVKHERNARIHLAFAILVFVAAILLRLSVSGLTAVFFAAILVFLAEIFNTAIERTLDLIDSKENPRIKMIKDMAAGAVLIASLAAVAIGLLVFLPAIGGVIWGR
ncbi:MAG TPA: diacylglycerol kinase family protein [Candidatus Saccharimonadia bacterium]|nr:diacylglycerol kinase family protein [Candidatus Saccharimonadia bacterium]